MGIIDRYIIRNFLGTFFFALALILSIAIVFDISEKIDDFIEKEAPLKAVVMDYYLNFIPYFGTLFSPLFIFISVIFFTSRMASRTEIIAILAGGMSYSRMLLPYMIASTGLALLLYLSLNWVIPGSNVKRLEFESRYIKNRFEYKGRNVHRQISPGQFIYFDSFNNREGIGYQFSYEKIEEGKLTYKLLAERILWDSLKNKWTLENYFIREIDSMKERTQSGYRFDTLFAFRPEEFSRRVNYIETMNASELNAFIRREAMRGSEELPFYLVEKHRRIAAPFSTFILTLIGVSISSRKSRSGIGKQIALGLVLSFAYIMFMQISTTFATNGNMPASLAVWIPNIVFGGMAAYLVRKAMN